VNLRDLFSNLLHYTISSIIFASFILIVIYGLISIIIFIMGFVLRITRFLIFVVIRRKRPPPESSPVMVDTEPQRIRSFLFYLFAPKTRGWRMCRLMILAVFILLALLAVYIVPVIFPVPDQRFELSKLRGLTPTQIIAKFGEPAMKWTNGNGELNYVYSHSRGWGFVYDVTFKYSHVIDVTSGER